MRIVLAPRPDDERYAQDLFVHDLTLFHGFSLLRPGPAGYRQASELPRLIVSHNPDELSDRRYIASYAGLVPIVVHLHTHLEYLKDERRDNAVKTISNATICIVPHELARERMVKVFPNVEWRVVHNGARKALYYPSTNLERTHFREKLRAAGFDIPPDKKLILFTGRLTFGKGLQIVERVAQVIDTIDHAACLLIQFPAYPSNDPFIQKEREEFKSIAQKLAKNPRVALWPDQGPRLPGRPVRFSDVLLMPSLSEVQPMVVLESLASGVPVVATLSTPFYKEMVEFGFNSTECSFPHLPKSFKEGASEEIKFRTDSKELDDTVAQVLSALNTMSIYDDEMRIELAKKAERAGFVDNRMYSKFLNIYNEAILFFDQKRTLQIENPKRESAV